jgi:hypothetical protein
MNVLCSLLALGPTSEDVFKKLIETHSKMTTGVFRARDTMSNAAGSLISLKEGVAAIAMPNQQIVVSTAKEMQFYDKIFDMVTISPNDQKVKPTAAIISVTNFHREPTAFLLEPEIRNSFFSDVQKSKGWVVTPNRLTLRKPNATTIIGYDSKYRVTEVQTMMGRKTIQNWKFEYPSNAAPITIPANASKVRGLPERPALPKGTKPEAISLCLSVWNAMARWRSGTATQQIEKDTFASSSGNGSFEETSKTGTWKWTKAQLEIRPKGKPQVTISKQTETYMNRLSKAGFTISPMARFAFNRQVPFLELFRNASKVSVDGTISTNGRKMKMLSVNKIGTKLRFLIDAQTNRVMQLSSDRIEKNGRAVPGGRLVITYR